MIEYRRINEVGKVDSGQRSSYRTSYSGESLQFIARVLVAIASPAMMLLLLSVSLCLAVGVSDNRLAFIMTTLPMWLRLVSLWRAKPEHAKLSYWLIGQFRASHLAETGLIMLRSIDFIEGRNPRYPQLRITIQESEHGNMWKINIRNRGWKAVGPIHIGAANLARLIAPGWLEKEIVDQVILNMRVPQIDTGILLPFMGLTVHRNKVPGFDVVSGSVIAAFFVHGGSELTAAIYRIDVEHPDDDNVAPNPGSDKIQPSQPKILFVYESSSHIPVLATLSDGTPYSGKASSSEGIADWTGNFVDGKPDGEFSVTLGDRMTGRARFNKGVRLDY
jgi:hypothetical protein